MNKYLLLFLILFAFSFAAMDVIAENSYYQVVFDERGQATVLNRMEIANIGYGTVNKITIEIPGKSLKLRYIMQSIQVRKNYTHTTGSYLSSKYVLVNTTKISDNKYALTLAKSLKSAEETSLVIYYKSFGYVKDDLLSKSFDFKTIKTPFDIDYTRISVKVDEDLHLKAGGTKSDYVVTSSDLKGLDVAPAKAMGSGSIAYAMAPSSFSSVKYSKGYVKTKRGLNVNETFQVYGSYSKHWILLHLVEVIVILVIILGGGYLIQNKAFPKLFPTPKKKVEQTNFSRVLTTSFISAFILSLLLAIIITIMGYMGFSTEIVPIAVVLGIIFTALLYVYLSNGRSVGESIATVIVHFVLSVILTPILFVIIMLVVSPIWPPYNYY